MKNKINLLITLPVMVMVILNFNGCASSGSGNSSESTEAIKPENTETISSAESEAVTSESTSAIPANSEETMTDMFPDQFTETWQKYYYDKLYEYIDSRGAMFNIYDLDGNGIPELLLAEKSFHAAGVEIFTVNQDDLLNLGTYGSWGNFQFDIDRKYIHSNFYNMGSGYESIYKLENNEMVFVVSLDFEPVNFDPVPEGAPIPNIYYINDKEVSEKEFEEENAKYDYELLNDFTARKYNVTPYAIERVLISENKD